ncbi:Yip1 domain family [Protomyces lactucae-debilis]|uniref:Protein YIP n=1 Tax=Protomyces lactucae-debilis TaxID=2754530 RepID=A0A1Y2ERT7_PROLT|nr:Yip1 domain family [Protomyces lactucae-debilis]ORY73896.1 Yip1 domain family [Protomyces lactucae-debilis]
MSHGYDKVIDADVEQSDGLSQPRTSLQFQSFHANDSLEAGQGATGRATNSSATGSGGGFFSSSSMLSSKQFLWSTGYYAQFFDVTSDAVLARLLAAIFPRANFFDTIEGNPDLYAPVWLATTVITVLYFSSTVAGYLAAHVSHQPYAYSFSTLTSAATLIYGYTFITPVLSWLILLWYKCEPSLLEVLCLYGYANAAWVPVSLVSISPLEFFHYATLSNWIRWVSVILGFTLSGFFLVRNLMPVLNRADSKTSQIMLIGVVALHAAFSLAIKFLFFSYVHEMDAPAAAAAV